VAKVWPIALSIALSFPVLMLSTYATLRWKSSWPVLVGVCFIMVISVLTAHLVQLVPATQQRTIFARYLYWAIVVALILLFAWRVFAHVLAP